jgi:MFS superfamily sulfate permease-like transporter
MLRPVADEVKKSGVRRIVLVACVGVILGFAFVIVKGPWLVSLFFKPLTASLSCAPTVEEALQQFEELQLICAVLGGVVALVILFFWRRFFRLRAEARRPQNTQP